MTLEQRENCIRLARRAHDSDYIDERPRSLERAQWWVGEWSYRLGIVDANGMIDVSGEVARLFVATYREGRTP